MRHLKPFLFLLAMLLSCLAGLSLGQDPETARAQAPVVGVPVGQQQGCNREYPVAPFGGGIDPNEAAAIAGCTPAQIDPFQSCGPEPTDQQAIQAWTQCLNQIQTQINQCVESGGQCPGYGNARPSSGPLTGGVTATCDPTTAPGCSSPQYGGSATASAGGIPFCGNVPVAANGSQCSDYPCGPQPGPTDPNIQQWLACYGEYTQGPSPCENPTQVNVGPSNLYNTCVSVAQPAPTANCTGANDPSCGITGSGGSCNAGSNAGATLPRAVADMGRLVSATIPAVPSCPPSSLCPDGSQPASDRGCSSQEQQLCQNGGANEDRIGVQAQIICQAIPPTPAPASASCAGAQAFSNANLGGASVVSILSGLCLAGDSSFEKGVRQCVTAFQNIANDQFMASTAAPATAIVAALNAPNPPNWVLVGASTQPRDQTRGTGTGAANALVFINPMLDAGSYEDGTPRNVCASLIHELTHALQTTDGSIDNRPVTLPEAVPSDNAIAPLPGYSVLVQRSELVAVTVENCWRAANNLPLRQYYFAYTDPVSGRPAFATLPAAVANPPATDNCTWPVSTLGG